VTALDAAYEWHGVNRGGTPAGGSMTMSPAHLASVVEARFKARWCSLTVTLDGVEVARIGQSEGKRIWWAEALR